PAGQFDGISFRVWDTSSWELLLEVGGVGQGGFPIATGAVAGTSFAAAYDGQGRIVLRDLVRNVVLWSAPLVSPSIDLPEDAAHAPLLVLEHVAIAPNGKYVVSYEGPGWFISRSNLAQADALGYLGSIVVRDSRDGSIVAM